jgi:hypothetical protein
LGALRAPSNPLRGPGDFPNEKNVDRNFGKVKAVKQAGKIIIDFFAQVENFQKKLWLKKVCGKLRLVRKPGQNPPGLL